jgi:hypothetical protein
LAGQISRQADTQIYAWNGRYIDKEKDISEERYVSEEVDEWMERWINRQAYIE